MSIRRVPARQTSHPGHRYIYSTERDHRLDRKSVPAVANYSNVDIANGNRTSAGRVEILVVFALEIDWRPW